MSFKEACRHHPLRPHSTRKAREQESLFLFIRRATEALRSPGGVLQSLGLELPAVSFQQLICEHPEHSEASPQTTATQPSNSGARAPGLVKAHHATTAVSIQHSSDLELSTPKTPNSQWDQGLAVYLFKPFLKSAAKKTSFVLSLPNPEYGAF